MNYEKVFRAIIDLPSTNPSVRIPTLVDNEHWKSDITKEKVNNKAKVKYAAAGGVAVVGLTKW
mgnify:CR=1 FL=1